MQVLVVDDSKVIRTLLRDAFEARGWEVDAAEDGLTGIRKASERRFDVIIIDVMMPGLNGFEACRKLAETRNEGRPLLVVYTNRFKDFQGRQQGEAAGADAFFTKEMDPATLARKVTELL